jgi:DNA repair exonuclease SbcCD ATPase subunit
MKIIEMTVENVKKIKAINIKPHGNMVIIEGKNEQGKTSLMDCIAYAIGGQRLIPDDPIRKGEKSGKVEIVFPDWIVTRTWTEVNTYIKIVTKDGAKISNPQQLLNSLMGDLSFDPMGLVMMNKEERQKLLKDITGISWDDLEEAYNESYQERTLLNRDIKDLSARLTSFEKLEPLQEYEELEELEERRTKIRGHNKQIEDAEIYIKSKGESIEELENNCIFIEQEILKLQAKIKNNLEKISSYKFEIEKKKPITALEKMDEKLIKDAIANTVKQKSLKEKWDQKKSIEDSLKSKQDNLSRLQELRDDLRKQKTNRIQSAKFPIEGLGFADDDITYQDIKFSEISMAQKIKVSMAIAMAKNPKIKVIRIMNGSLLDSDSMKEVERLATYYDFQVWIERVADNKNSNAIYIEDGEVK